MVARCQAYTASTSVFQSPASSIAHPAAIWLPGDPSMPTTMVVSFRSVSIVLSFFWSACSLAAVAATTAGPKVPPAEPFASKCARKMEVHAESEGAAAGP